MLLEMAALDGAQRYKLLTSTITPRPIAWVVTQDGSGHVNLAPFSCFNLMGYTPPVLAIGIQAREDGSVKDTLANVAATRELAVNLVTASDTETMVRTAANFPEGADEAAMAGVALLPSTHIAPPRIASAPVSFECRLFDLVEAGPQQAIVVAEILTMHIDDRCLIDADRCHVDTPALDLVARMHGPAWYLRCGDIFDQPFQPSFAQTPAAEERR
jgi:flavin reductase (DIM6/NTAB) family NADH-FMN oxidoreductase RutF